MSKISTNVILSSVDSMVYGISRFEITARRVKAYGTDALAKEPKYVANRGSITGNESPCLLYEHVKAHRIAA